MKKTFILTILLILPVLLTARQSQDRRDAWLEYIDRIARPVMQNLANDRLKEVMPVELPENSDNPEH